VLALATALWPDWIELLTGQDPDLDDGRVESLVLGVVALVAITLLALARRDLRRAAGPSSQWGRGGARASRCWSGRYGGLSATPDRMLPPMVGGPGPACEVTLIREQKK
jgi:hypothetical protein